MAEIKRNIYYYDLQASKRNVVTGRYEKSGKVIDQFFLDLKEQQKYVSEYSDFLCKASNGDDYFVVIDNVTELYIEYRIVLCRTDALPYIETYGKLEKLGDYIDKNQNIAEITHCVYFREYGIMGGEYNFSGARPTIIANYITRRLNDVVASCQVKLNYDTYKQLIEGEEFSLFDFSVKTNSEAYNDILSRKSIFSAIQTTVPGSDTMEIVLKRRKTSKNKFSGFELPLDFEEIKELLTNHREDIEKFKVSQGTIGNALDLLSDKLVHKVTFVQTDERTIDSKAMYKEIRNYFNETAVGCCNK